VGEMAARHVDGLLAVGPRARWIAQGAESAGLDRVLTADDSDQAVFVLERELAPGVGDLLLVKGSRGVELDRLVEAIAAAPRAASGVDGGGGC
jgi:UDP-N-acetylmuramoyl-tripeptide--D-alanyl-D-alanine ligase